MNGEANEAETMAFDAEANAARPGWSVASNEWAIAGDSVEVWTATIRGNTGLVWQAGQGWCFMVLDGADLTTILAKGISSRRGWAMDGCNEGAPQSH